MGNAKSGVRQPYDDTKEKTVDSNKEGKGSEEALIVMSDHFR